jgi:hypothetical protein
MVLIYKPPGEEKQLPVVVVRDDESADPDNSVEKNVAEYFVVAGFDGSGLSLRDFVPQTFTRGPIQKVGDL